MKLVLIIMMFAITSFTNELDSLIVLDSTFAIVKTVSDSNELNEIAKIWNEKSVVILRARPRWTHNINFFLGSRWLYHKSGFATLLTKNNSPIYKIKAYNELNSKLGIFEKD